MTLYLSAATGALLALTVALAVASPSDAGGLPHQPRSADVAPAPWQIDDHIAPEDR